MNQNTIVPSDDKDSFPYDKLINQIYPKTVLIKSSILKGGVTVHTEIIELETLENETKKIVLRIFKMKNIERYKKKVQQVYQLLTELKDINLHTPFPIYFDTSLKIYPFPFIVLEFIEGKTEFNPKDLNDFLIKFTLNLTNIHKIDLQKHNFSFLDQQDVITNFRLENLTSDKVINQYMLDVYTQIKSKFTNKHVLLHTDYWPGNIIWNQNEIVGIIDWDDAHIGDPIKDIADTRLELLWAFGTDTMNKFTQLYQKNMPQANLKYLPFWDLYFAKRVTEFFSEWAENEEKRKDMIVKHKWFEQQAESALNKLL